MDEVIIYDKSLQERLQEYLDVFSNYEQLHASEIKKVWVFFVDCAVDRNGWQALWKIPRLTCESLKIPFPTIVLVYVDDIDCYELTATVKILAVQDDIHLPDKHFVQLLHLWPTKEQDKTIALNLNTTANAIDMLRFFYNNIFMPWDHDNDDTSAWIHKHLETRLRLFYEMKSGVIPRATAEHLKSLVTEAKHLQARRERIEAELSDSEESDLELTNTDNKNVHNLVNIHVKMVQIQSEVELLENPLTRNILLRRKDELGSVKSGNPENWVIFEEGKIDEYVLFLNKVKEYWPTQIIKLGSSLASVLDAVNAGSSIIVGPCKHRITTTGELEKGGTLKGITSRAESIITTSRDDIMLDFSGGNIFLENLTLDAGCSQCGIVVRGGNLTLRNCKIVGDGKSSIHQGIIVLAGGTLELISCDVTDFSTGIVCNSGSTIAISKSEIFNVNIGLKIYDNCNVTINHSTFYNSKEYGIFIESDTIKDNNIKMGNFTILDNIPGIVLDDITGKNNLKSDAIISKKPKIKPVHDLFSNSIFDSTISGLGDEMDINGYADTEQNNTIIEKIDISI